MMKKFILLSLFITTQVWGFTLNNNFGAAFKKGRVKVYIARNNTCPNVNTYDLQELVKPAVDKFWNKVPKSSLRLISSGFGDNITNINSGKLCAPTDGTCITAATAANELIPPVTDIVISCNDNSANFGGTGVLAVTIPNSFSGKKIKGSVILIQDSAGSTTFANLSRSDKIAVIAHEIGHAVGLGHSEDDDALMYYRTVNMRSALGQDDVDGISYLYPVHIDACGLLAGTITTDTDPRNPGMMLMMLTSFGLLVLLFEIRKLLKKLKLPDLRIRLT